MEGWITQKSFLSSFCDSRNGNKGAIWFNILVVGLHKASYTDLMVIYPKEETYSCHSEKITNLQSTANTASSTDQSFSKITSAIDHSDTTKHHKATRVTSPDQSGAAEAEMAAAVAPAEYLCELPVPRRPSWTTSCLKASSATKEEQNVKF